MKKMIKMMPKWKSLLVAILATVCFAVLAVTWRSKVMLNHINNHRATIHASEWCSAIIRGGTNDSFYTVTPNQLALIRRAVGHELTLLEFRRLLPFHSDSWLLPVDGRDRDFMISLKKEEISDSIYYYDVTLSYYCYTVFGATSLRSKNCHFAVKLASEAR